MRLPQFPAPEATALWRITHFGEHTNPAGRAYWYENRGRQPTGAVVIQASVAGRIVFHHRRDQPVEPGQIVIFTYGSPTAYGWREPLPEPYRCRWVNLVGAGLAEHAHALTSRHGHVITGGATHDLAGDLGEVIELARADGVSMIDTAAAVFTLMMHLFEAADQQRRQVLTPVERAVDHLLRRRGKLSLKQVAATYGVSREHLSRVFRQRTGRPATDYLSEQRRRRALRLLRDTALPLHAVAEQAGYAHVHTMARQLRAATGQSPSKLRGG